MTTPYSTEFDDIYFSPEDGPAETAHVFLRGNDLPARFEKGGHFTIAELGFGTGLNILMAARLFLDTAPMDARLDVVSFEKYPLTAAAISDALTPFAGRFGMDLLESLLRDYPPRIPGFHRLYLHDRVTLTLVFDDVMDGLPHITVPRGVDAWFLDGFAPAKNPGMWREDIFEQMARHSAPGATCATFTVAGAVRRGLAAAGFAVEKRPGFGRKREMLAGHYSGPGITGSQEIARRVAILGGGLAGAAAGWSLRRRGIDSVIYDPAGMLASGASGNRTGLCNPRLSAHRTPQADFYMAGYARAVRRMPALDCGFMSCGNLHLMHTPDREKRFTATVEHWSWDHAHMRTLDRDAAAAVAGVAVPCGGILLPDTGHVDPAALCRAYAANTPLRAVAAEPVADGRGWRIGDECYDAVIGAHGMAAAALMPGLPLEAVRGQISIVKATAATAPLAVNLCYGGYFGAAQDGQHTLGATFQRGETDTALRAADDRDNIAKLSALLPHLAAGLAVSGGRAAIRCAAQDRFPVAGAVPGRPGLYLSTAHGSHGLLSTISAADFLADSISGGVHSLPVPVQEILAPGRFAARARRRR